MTLDDAVPLRPPSRAGFSMKNAMIVPGIGVVILILFIGAGFLTKNPVQHTKTSSASFSVAGTPLRAKPAVKDLRPIIVSGQPPGNIINAVSVPVGASRTSSENNTAAGQGDYSAQITLSIDQSQTAVANFYKLDMKKQGWQSSTTGPADHHPGSLEVLAKKAGSDGFYWEMAAVVSPTTFGPKAPAAGVTSFTLELFQQPDPD
jgi:hypothetical protein